MMPNGFQQEIPTVIFHKRNLVDMGAKESKVVKTENAGDSVHSQKPQGATVQVN